MDKATLISMILQLDADTYAGIDDPGYLQSMTLAELSKYLEDMQEELDNG